MQPDGFFSPSFPSGRLEDRSLSAIKRPTTRLDAGRDSQNEIWFPKGKGGGEQFLSRTLGAGPPGEGERGERQDVCPSVLCA
jgi:hypothetical protein